MRSRIPTTLLLVAANVAFFWQVWHPVLRFTSFPANAALGSVLAFALPWTATAMIYSIGCRWSKTIAIVAGVFSIFYSAALSLVLPLEWDAAAFKQVAHISWNESDIRVYQTNGGATTDFGIVIRQERTIVPGVRVVRNVESFYPCQTVRLSASLDGVSIHGQVCSDLNEEDREYKLKPLVYF